MKIEVGTRVVHKQHELIGTVMSVDDVICGNQMYYVDFGKSGSFSVNDKSIIRIR